MTAQKQKAPASLPSDAKARLADLLGEASALFDVLGDAASSETGSIAGELKRISEIIDQTRSDIRQLGTGDLSEDKIPRAGQELAAVVKSTEDATNTIMAAAEDILGADTSDSEAYQSLVTDKVMQIFEACSFQDITGQRVTKVVQTLEKIEERISAIAETFGLDHRSELDPDDAEARRNALLLNGPALEGEGIAQNDVDGLFAEAGIPSQDSIDDIFGSYKGGDEDTSGKPVNQDDIDSLFD